MLCGIAFPSTGSGVRLNWLQYRSGSFGTEGLYMRQILSDDGLPQDPRFLGDTEVGQERA